jgi:hypothetical protein
MTVRRESLHYYIHDEPDAVRFTQEHMLLAGEGRLLSTDPQAAQIRTEISRQNPALDVR